MTHSPLAIFAYKRPSHLKAVLDSLSQCAGIQDTPLFIFLDGFSEKDTDKDRDAVNATRRLVENHPLTRGAEICKSEQNMGLANSIRTGVTKVLSLYERIIVLEDDIVVSPSFLAYHNFYLDYFCQNENVASIHAYCYPLDEKVKKNLPLFFTLRGADCWGWSTWKDRWEAVCWDAKKLFQDISSSGELERFDFMGAYPYFKMLENSVEGKIDSWAIHWHASMFLQNKFTIYPQNSFVDNIGNDGSGTHCYANASFAIKKLNSTKEFAIPEVEDNQRAINAFRIFFTRNKKRKKDERLFSKIKRKIFA